MDNYLLPRWPTGEREPLCTPAGAGRGGKRPHRLRRSLLAALAALLALGCLGGAAFWGVQLAADRFNDWADSVLPEPSGSPGASLPVLPWEAETPDWSEQSLPAALPDPEGALELSERVGDALAPGEIYEKVIPSVVQVQTAGAEGVKLGSGFFISESGYLITNYHVIAEGFDLAVMTVADGKLYRAAFVGGDEELDLAVLKAEGGSFVPIALGSSDELRVGDAVYAVGNPMGYLYGTMTDGIVSAIADRTTELDYPGQLILTTAPLNSGNSGGALVDAWGRVVGINTAKITGLHDDVMAEGLGLAIPLADAKPYLERILRTGATARPSIGIQCYDAQLDGLSGVLVDAVTEGTPAEHILHADDLIYGANGQKAATVDELTRIFAALEPGDSVELMVLRKGRHITLTVELYDRLTFDAE